MAKPKTAAYDYQRRVLGTDIERKLVADDGKTSVFADSVTPDGTAYTAWDAKHSGGGPKAIHEGNAEPFIQNSSMAKFDDQMRRYEEVIQSPGNPVNKLVIVTNTPEAQAFLTKRLQGILNPNTPFEVQLIP
ncbi:restriction endonuclease fold toxin-2 domain-containing protein [Actinomyces bowdenii]|uniref:restriction endonuclease fold toxin-2 domain-containing protein n=1 Tax=Actinomyces bowdenii TaxID=131109 RepID=UPI00312CA798